MKLKKLFTHLCAIALAGTISLTFTPAHGMDGDDGMPDLEELDLDPDLLIDKPSLEGSRALIGPIDAIGIGTLLGRIGLKEPLWISTKPEKGRDILYLMPSKITSIEYGGGSCNLFFNMTSKMNLTGSNLLNIDQINQSTIGALPGLPASIKNKDQIGSLLPFAKKITIQERKLGSYFQAGYAKGAFLLQFHTSLQLGERNFYLNQHDLAEIQALNTLVFGEDQSYDESNLYRIRVGMGDTRVKLGLNALNSKILQTDVGMECIIPTSRSSRKFLSAFDDTQLNDDEFIYSTAINSLLSVRDYLLTPEIGNGGHFGLGFYMESKFNLFKNLAELVTRVSFDKFFEADEQRLMVQKQSGITALSLENFNVLATPAEAQAAVIKFAKEYLIPLPYRVSTEPGGIFNGIMILNIPYKKWNFRYGYDFYFQQAEQFKHVYADQAVQPLLRTELARVGTMTQHKISSETTYRIKNFNNINLDIGFGGDTTIAAHNIGKDWTVYLKFASEF